MKSKAELIEAIEIALEVKRRDLKNSFFEFFCYFWDIAVPGEDLRLNWHIKLICHELQVVGERVIKRLPKKYDLLVNVPPGETKSTMASVMFPVWLWVNDPQLWVGTGGWDSDLANAQSQMSRDIIRSEKFQELFGHEVRIRRDLDRVTRYATVDGGQRKTTSVGASIIGRHMHIWIVDDPLDAQKVNSEEQMQRASDWVFKTLTSRVKDKEVAPLVLIMQRLGDKDPAGTMLKMQQDGDISVRHICLPGTDEYPIKPERLKRRYIDGLMNPLRNTKAGYANFKTKIGSRAFAGQVGQAPYDGEGNIIKRAWLPVVPMEKLPLRFRKARRDFTVDTSFKSKRTSDPMGILSYSAVGGYLVIWSYAGGRLRFSELINFLLNFVRDRGTVDSKLYIEPKASGPSAVEVLEDHTNLNVMEWVMPEGNKEVRLQTVEPFFEAARVILVDGPWVEDFIEQVVGFPNKDHDEEVDVLVMAAFNTFMRGVLRQDSSDYNVNFFA